MAAARHHDSARELRPARWPGRRRLSPRGWRLSAPHPLLLRRKPIRILSLDGGGSRGVLSSLLLTALEREIRRQSADPNARIAQYFDLIAGTSIGGILTALLTAPAKDGITPRFSAADTHNQLLQQLPSAFANLHSAGSRGLLTEKYDGRSLEKLMRAVFGSTPLSALVRPTLITAYDLKDHSALFFCSHDYYSPQQLKRYGLLPLDPEPKPDWLLRDVCRATSAAPVVFKPAHIAPLKADKNPLMLIDGGIFATNPTLCAYAEIRAKWKNNPRVTDMLIVSVGNGNSQEDVDTGGYLTGWGGGLQLIELLMSAGTEATHFQMDRIYGEEKQRRRIGRGSYWRFNWALPESISMDKADSETLNSLLRLTGDLGADDERDWIAQGAEAADWLNRKDKEKVAEVARLLLAK